MGNNIENIEKIMKLFENAKITKMDLEFEDIKISLEKQATEASVIYKTIEEAPVVNVTSNNNTPEVISNKKYITAPLVGTFYSARSPQSDPFVFEGKKVKKGDVVCIIEAMKVLNEVTADCDGTISKVLVNNEDLVMYGQQLFEIGD